MGCQDKMLQAAARHQHRGSVQEQDRQLESHSTGTMAGGGRAATRTSASASFNLVLAPDSCNGHKGSLLAAEEHLAHWMKRNNQHSAVIQTSCSGTNSAADLGAAVEVAHWAYGQACAAGSMAWVSVPARMNISSAGLMGSSPLGGNAVQTLRETLYTVKVLGCAEVQTPRRTE